MIGKMHEKTDSPLFKIIFALVSLSFVLGGIGGGLMLHDDSAVKVNGEKISQQQFLSAKGREQNLRNTQEGEIFWEKLENPAYLHSFNQDIFNGLINDELLRQFANDLKLNVSVEQIKSEIVNTAAFQSNGKFDNALYQQTLRNNGISAEQYAAIVGQGILMSQLQEGIIGTHFNVPAQQALLANLLLQKREIRLATYPIATEVEKQTTNEKEIQDFYDKHQQLFKTPEKFTVEYVLFSPKEIEDRITISDEQIDTYYQTNKNNYVTETESQLAHIQLASEEEANSILQAIKNGENFAKLAADKSLDRASATQGGDLGWAKSGTFPAAFEQAASTLKVGEISTVVNVDGAFHLIKVLNRKEGKNLALADVKQQIAATIRSELLQTEYANTARAMAKMAYENSGSLNDIAKLGNTTVQTSEEFTANTVPSLLSDEKITKLLFSDLRHNGQISEAIELSNGNTMFLRISQYQAEDVQGFDEAKNRVIEAVKLEKAQRSLLAKVEQDLKALQAGETSHVNFGNAQELVFAEVQNTQPRLADTVFSMPKPTDKPNYGLIRETNGDLLIVALNKVIDGEKAHFDRFASQFAAADQVVLFNTLLNDLRDKASIKLNEDFVEQQNNNSH